MSLRVRAVERVEEVAAHHWQRLARGKTVYASQPWHRFCEELRPLVQWCLIAEREDGEVLGILPVAVEPTGRPSNSYDPAHLFGPAVGGEAAPWYPGLVAGARSGFVNELLLGEDASFGGERDVLVAFASAVQELAVEVGATRGWFPYTPRADGAKLCDALGVIAAPVFTGGEAILELPKGTTFESYLTSLPSRTRRNARLEIARFRESGASVSWHRLSEVAEEAAPLLHDVNVRHGLHGTIQATRTRIEAQARLLDELSVVFCCRRGGAAVACVAFYVFGRAMFARFYGCDSAAVDDFEYFNLLFYEPIRYAVENGLQAIHLGLASYPKLIRGAELRPLWSVVVGEALNHERIETWNTARLRAFLDEHGRLVHGGVDADAWAPIPPSGNGC